MTISLLLTASFLSNAGCVSLLAQRGTEADIQGRVVMPDGTAATDVVLFINYTRWVRIGAMDFYEEPVFEKKIAKDGRFRLFYPKVGEVIVAAQKTGWTSFSYVFRDQLRVDDVVIQLEPAGEFRELGKLYDVHCMLDLTPETEGGGVKVGEPQRGDTRKILPVDRSDFFVRRVPRKTAEGHETEHLLFKVRDGFGLHLVASPNPRYVPILLADLTLAPKNKYETTEILLRHTDKPPQPIAAYFRTPDGKYGAIRINKWYIAHQYVEGQKPLWHIDFSYVLNPDGTPHLNRFLPLESVEQGKPK